MYHMLHVCIVYLSLQSLGTLLACKTLTERILQPFNENLKVISESRSLLVFQT